MHDTKVQLHFFITYIEMNLFKPFSSLYTIAWNKIDHDISRMVQE